MDNNEADSSGYASTNGQEMQDVAQPGEEVAGAPHAQGPAPGPIRGLAGPRARRSRPFHRLPRRATTPPTAEVAAGSFAAVNGSEVEQQQGELQERPQEQKQEVNEPHGAIEAQPPGVQAGAVGGDDGGNQPVGLVKEQDEEVVLHVHFLNELEDNNDNALGEQNK